MEAWALLIMMLAMGQEVSPAQAAAPPAAISSPSAEKADVCAVSLTPKLYAGQSLQLSGIVTGAATDKLILTSKDCHKGIALGFSDRVQGHDDVKTLFAAVRRRDADKDGGQISADLEGTLLLNEQGEIVRLQVNRIDGLRFPKRPAPKSEAR